MKELNRPLTVVAHDAGAAAHLFAWLIDEQPTICLSGPALTLWHGCFQKKSQLSTFESGLHSHQNSVQAPLPEHMLAFAITGASTVITGTGWESNLEHEARRLAREQGIYSIAVIDHWTNYKDRFVRKGELILPDEIWVSDPYAAVIARAAFPAVRVVQQSNVYQAMLVEEVESRQLPAAVQGNDRVLYVLEPIRSMWGELSEPGEFLALDYFMAQRHLAPVAADAEIRLRPHPSDPLGKYDSWLSRQVYPRVSLDLSTSLADALAWSNVVVGCQTYAMVLALACGQTAICTIPPWAPNCVLPQPDIIHLSRICDLSTPSF